jgi:hypothetical protein
MLASPTMTGDAKSKPSSHGDDLGALVLPSNILCIKKNHWSQHMKFGESHNNPFLDSVISDYPIDIPWLAHD